MLVTSFLVMIGTCRKLIQIIKSVALWIHQKINTIRHQQMCVFKLLFISNIKILSCVVHNALHCSTLLNIFGETCSHTQTCTFPSATEKINVKRDICFCIIAMSVLNFHRCYLPCRFAGVYIDICSNFHENTNFYVSKY